MTFGLYLLLNLVLFLFLAIWLRSVVVRRLRPERVLDQLDGQIRTLIAELNQTGDYNISLLEDRVRELRTLVSDADRQIEEITAAIESLRYHRGAAGAGSPVLAEQEPVYTVRFSEASAAGAEGSRGEGDRETARSDESAPGAPGATRAHDPAGAAEAEAGRQSAGGLTGEPDGHATGHGAPFDPPVGQPPAETSPREIVWKLHDEGLSPDLIAVRSGMAIGEVELIISLRAGKGRR